MYENGKIYIIRNTINNIVYIGSTCNPLSKRFYQHKNDSKKKSCENYKLYIAFKELGIENFYIELLKDYPCENIEQLRAEEGKYIRKYMSKERCYNKKIEGRTKTEHMIMYYKNNKDKINKYHKEYVKNNKNKINKYHKEYVKNNKNKIIEYQKEYNKNNKNKIIECQKEYNKNNKNKIIECQKEYRKNNKDKLKEYRKKKILCEYCGYDINLNNKERHYKTIIHKQNVKYCEEIEKEIFEN